MTMDIFLFTYMCFFPLSQTRHLPVLTIHMSNTTNVFKEVGTAYPPRAPIFTRGCLVMVRVAHLISFLCCVCS